MRARSGFTLVEIMIVVALIGMLASIAVPNFITANNAAARNACRAELEQLNAAIDMYDIDNGYPPGSSTWATDLAPYMRTVPTTCPLDNDGYTYNSGNTPPDVTCGNTGH